jgi:hypothetical protein
MLRSRVLARVVIASLLPLVSLPACSSDEPPPSQDAAAGAATDANAADTAAGVSRDAQADAGGADGPAGDGPVVDAPAVDGPSVDGLAAGGADAPGADATADAAPPAVTAADFPAAVARAYCATQAKCCPGAGTAGCEAMVGAQMTDILMKAPSMKNVFDEQKAARCLAAIAALGDSVVCVPWFMSTQPALRVCDSVLDGTVAPGQECAGVAECQRNAAIERPEGGSAGCSVWDGVGPKRCRAFWRTSTPGTPCEMGFHGSASQVFVCTGGLECTNGQCGGSTQPKQGEPCPTGGCAPGLLCQAGSCQPPAGQGAPCANAICGDSFFCDETSKTCLPMPPVPWILDIGFWATTYSCG